MEFMCKRQLRRSGKLQWDNRLGFATTQFSVLGMVLVPGNLYL